MFRKKSFKCNMINDLTCNVIEENWRKKYTTVKNIIKKPRKYSKRAVVKV